ncbi:hypothetical protein B0H13DRAFT_1601324, partial [Mycena leptocephala]
DIQSWLRTKRLHKYSHCFQRISWDEMLKLTDSDLKNMGVYTVGARGRLMKFINEFRNHRTEVLKSSDLA